MMHLHVVARSQEAADDFARRHTAFDPARLTIHQGVTSYFELLDRIIRTSDHEVDCIVHDDVFLSDPFGDHVDTLRSELAAEWPNWGVCGNAGIMPLAVGAAATRVVRYVFDPHGGPNFQGTILPAIGVDGHMLLLNTARLREKGVRLPAFQGFQLYDVTLCLETLRAGLAVLIAPHLACYHASAGSQAGFDAAAKSPAYGAYLASVVRNRTVPTINGPLSVPLVAADRRGALEVEMDSLRAAVTGRAVRRVAIVVRSECANPPLLRRAIESIAAFRAAAGDAIAVLPVVVTARPEACPDFVRRHAAIVSEGGPAAGRAPHETALRSIEADYVWLLPEGSWLYPNAAERVAFALAAAPRNAVLVTDAQQFFEDLSEDASVIGRGYRVAEGPRLSAAHWFTPPDMARSGPLPNMVFNKALLLEMLRGAGHGDMRREAFVALYSILRSLKQVPILVGSLAVGVSLDAQGRQRDHTDEGALHKSFAEIAPCLCTDMESPDLLSVLSMDRFIPRLPPAAAPVFAETSGAGSDPERTVSEFGRAERLALVGIRLSRGVVRAAITPSRWVGRAKLAGSVLAKEGVKGFLRKIATSGLPRR